MSYWKNLPDEEKETWFTFEIRRQKGIQQLFDMLQQRRDNDLSNDVISYISLFLAQLG